MTINSKLILNMLLTLAGIAVIGGVSLVGIKFVQGQLFVLTEHSPPFQLKTIEMQRALQEHTSNLLRVAFSTSINRSSEELAALATELSRMAEWFEMGNS